MKIIAHITRLSDGETRRTEHEYPDGAEHVFFHWTEGNYGCDCNRQMFFDGSDSECGTSKFSVRLTWPDGSERACA